MQCNAMQYDSVVSHVITTLFVAPKVNTSLFVLQVLDGASESAVTSLL